MSGGSRTGLVAGGIAVIVLLVAGVWTAVLVRALGSDGEPDEAAGAGSIPGGYTMVDDLCDRLDYGAAFAILPKSGGGPMVQTIPTVAGVIKECMQDLSRGSSVGSVWITTRVFDDLVAAERSYAYTLEDGMPRMDPHTVDAVDGPWQEGVLGLGAVDGFTAGAEACARDVNLVVCAAMRVAVAPEHGVVTDQDVGAAVLELAREVVARASDDEGA